MSCERCSLRFPAGSHPGLSSSQQVLSSVASSANTVLADDGRVIPALIRWLFAGCRWCRWCRWAGSGDTTFQPHYQLCHASWGNQSVDALYFNPPAAPFCQPVSLPLSPSSPFPSCPRHKHNDGPNRHHPPRLCATKWAQMRPQFGFQTTAVMTPTPSIHPPRRRRQSQSTAVVSAHLPQLSHYSYYDH